MKNIVNLCQFLTVTEKKKKLQHIIIYSYIIVELINLFIFGKALCYLLARIPATPNLSFRELGRKTGKKVKAMLGVGKWGRIKAYPEMSDQISIKVKNKFRCQ